MSWLFIIIASSYVATGDTDRGLVAAVIAVAFAIMRRQRSWLSREWNDALRRNSDDATLFSGGRDED